MLLRHATIDRNLSSIGRAGLLCSKSRGKLPVVWLHAQTASVWALLHTVKRHNTRPEQVVILEVDVPRRWLKRSKRRLWYCPRDIPPDRIRHVIGFRTVAASPLEATA